MMTSFRLDNGALSITFSHIGTETRKHVSAVLSDLRTPRQQNMRTSLIQDCIMPTGQSAGFLWYHRQLSLVILEEFVMEPQQ